MIVIRGRELNEPSYAIYLLHCYGMNLIDIRGVNSLVYSPTFCHSLPFVAEALDFSKPRIILHKQQKFSGIAP